MLENKAENSVICDFFYLVSEWRGNYLFLLPFSCFLPLSYKNCNNSHVAWI